MAGGALRSIFARFGVEFDKSGALPKGDKAVNSLTDSLLGIGKTLAAAFAVDALVGFTKDLLQQADVLAKQSGALGVSAAELQGWQHAAQLSGSSAEEFTAAFTKFNRNIAEGADGLAAQSDAFKALGINIKDAVKDGAKPIDLLDQVADGLIGIEEPARRTQVVMDLFGKSGAKLLPLFSEGSEGIAKLRAEVGELGASFDEAFLDNAQEFNDNIDRLKLGVRGLAIQAIGPMLPTLVRWTQGSIRVIKQLVSWIRQTKILQAAAVALGTKGFFALLRALPALAARFIGMTAAGKALLGRLGVLRAAFITLGRFVLRTVLPFLLLEDALTFLTGGDSVIGEALDKMFGPGTSGMVRDWCKDLIEAIGFMLGVVGDGFALLWEEVTGGFPLITELWNRLWTDALITFAKAKLAIIRGWNSLADAIGVPSLKIDTSDAEADIQRLKDQYNQIGMKAPAPPGFAEGVRDSFAPSRRALPDVGSPERIPALVRDSFGQKPGEVAGRAAARSAFGVQAPAADGGAFASQAPAGSGGFGASFAAPLDPSVLRPTAVTVPTPPPQVTNNDVKQSNQIHNTFMAAPGTPVEQQSAIAGAATKGTREGLNTKALYSALVPTPG